MGENTILENNGELKSTHTMNWEQWEEKKEKWWLSGALLGFVSKEGCGLETDFLHNMKSQLLSPNFSVLLVFRYR